MPSNFCPYRILTVNRHIPGDIHLIAIASDGYTGGILTQNIKIIGRQGNTIVVADNLHAGCIVFNQHRASKRNTAAVPGDFYTSTVICRGDVPHIDKGSIITID